MNLYIGTNNKNILNNFSNYSKEILNEYLEYDNIKSDYVSFFDTKSADYKLIQTDEFEILFDGYCKLVDEIHIVNYIKEKAEKIFYKKENIENADSGIYNIIIIEKATGKVVISSDPSALFPIYYGIINDSFVFSSHMHIMSKSSNRIADTLGVLQKIVFGFTLGSRTLYSGISRLNPAENIIYHPDKNSIEAYYSTPYYSSYNESSTSIDAINDVLVDSFSKHYNKCPKIGIMMSEGFDSRLMAGYAQKCNFKIYTFTHGTKGSQGESIVNDVANEINSTHYFDSLLNGFPSDIVKLNTQLLLADNLNLPFWISGSEYFKSYNKNITVTAGTALDTTLGGHAFFKPSREIAVSVKQRYIEIFLQNINCISSDYIEKLSAELISNFKKINLISIENSLKTQFSDSINTILKTSLSDLIFSIEEEFLRIKESGSELLSMQLQRYFLENRVRKFSFGQELTLRLNNKLIVPSYEYSIMNILCKIHPKYKLHHELYLKYFEYYFKNLSNIKNGGYGLPIKYPRFILESSRFYLKWMEKRNIKVMLDSNCKLSPSVFRAVMITDYNLHNNNYFENIKKIVVNNNNVFNERNLLSKIDKIINYEKRAFNMDEIYTGIEVSKVFEN